jgi:hypothetical protein
MDARGRKSRCKARTRAGKPCQAAATVGGLCFFHANPNKASELGRIGGRSKRSSVAESADLLPKVDTALAVRDTVARLIADVYAGRLHPRVAGGLAPLLNLQMRAIETTDLERRLAKLEKLSDEAGAEEDLGRKEDRASLSGLADTLNYAGKRYERQGRAETREGPGSSVDPMEAT